jgi:hypothetical protein
VGGGSPTKSYGLVVVDYFDVEVDCVGRRA